MGSREARLACQQVMVTNMLKSHVTDRQQSGHKVHQTKLTLKMTREFDKQVMYTNVTFHPVFLANSNKNYRNIKTTDNQNVTFKCNRDNCFTLMFSILAESLPSIGPITGRLPIKKTNRNTIIKQYTNHTQIGVWRA